jgi:hypothetical protein
MDPYTDSADVWGNAPEMLPRGAANIPLIPGQAVPAVSISRGLSAVGTGTGTGTGEGTSADGAAAAFGANAVNSAPQVKNLRASGKSGSRFEELEIEFEKEIEKDIDVAKGELWWIFQSVDVAVERFIEYVDEEIGDGHGHRVLKLILLVAPVMAIVIATAIRVLVSGRAVPFRDNSKKI